MANPLPVAGVEPYNQGSEPMHQHKSHPDPAYLQPAKTYQVSMPCVLSQLLEITKEDWLNG